MATASVRSHHEVDDDDESFACKLSDDCKLVEMTHSDMSEQLRKVQESEGFESDACFLSANADFLEPCRLLPDELDSKKDWLKELCEFAIESYNTEHGTELKFVNVVQANRRIDFQQLGEEYYITFTALDPRSGLESLYQAKVLEPFGPRGALPREVFICRPKT